MKAMFRRLFELTWRDSPGKRASSLVAIQLLKEIWKTLTVDSIRNGSSIYEGDFGPSIGV
jgi:hypothetical protein